MCLCVHELNGARKVVPDSDYGLFRFEWQKDQYGYEFGPRAGPSRSWAVIQRKGGPFLGYRLDIEGTDAGLCRQFASLDPTFDKAIGFANQYGFLVEKRLNEEPIQLWLDWIWRMKDLVTAIDEDRYEDFWKGFNEPHYHDKPLFAARIEPHEVVPKKSKFQLVPQSLLAAMWFELGNYATKGTALKQCEFCPKWFPVGPGTGRKPSKRFCSDKCRVAWHRRHKGGNDAR